MDSQTIRRRFVDFFAARDHTVVPSSSLIPADPTLLLTTAGMVQFKPYLMGDEPPPYPRAVTVQKSFRTVDIDIIGTTARHLTFFEMLGNFSFGDYFKEKAIPFAYEFVTEHLGLDPEVLWYTVYETDDEAAAIWIDDVGVPADRLQRGGKDNFWQMGVPGPCGPSSEIFVDRGERFGEGGGPIGGDEDRYVEVWNLVFMQNIQDEPYHVIGDLPARNIDTGSGLERVAAVLQRADSVFEVDTIRPVLAAAERATATSHGADERVDLSLRIMADHGRGITFLIGDGVVPSNEGRGYILRRLLRRAVRHAWSLGAEKHVTPLLVDATVETMRAAYPGLGDRRDYIVDMAEQEEFNFRRTLQSGYAQLEDELQRAEGNPISGAAAFRLHDTYGFPVELTEEIAAEQGLGVDRIAFDALMEEQRSRARAAWKGAAAAEETELYRSLLNGLPPTEFVGYEQHEAEAAILAIVREGALVDRAEEGEEVEVLLDRTPFYAESGGQIGDIGSLVSETGRMAVGDTQFALTGYHGHRGTVLGGSIQVGQHVDAVIDLARRERIMKSHTGTHIVHWALREVLGKHVQQAGSLVEAGRLRFDFSHHAAMTAEEAQVVERMANERVIANAGVHAYETSRQEAQELGALAFFGDKYGERVRVVEVGSYSRELCGGTHVRTAGETGPLLVVAEGSIGANMRRIEVVSGATAYERIAAIRRQLEQAAGVLRSGVDGVADAVEVLATRAKEQEARLAAFEDQRRAGAAGALLDRAEERAQGRLLVEMVGASTPDDLRLLAIQARDGLGKGVVVLGATSDGKGSLVATVSPELVAAGVSAGDIVAEPARLLGGGGSRDPELAQAGGPRGAEIEEAVALARERAAAALEALRS